MSIHVCHVKRKNIPNFVFPGGVRPSQPAKPPLATAKVTRTARRKRKQDDVVSRSDASLQGETIEPKRLETDNCDTSSSSSLVEKSHADIPSIKSTSSPAVPSPSEAMTDTLLVKQFIEPILDQPDASQAFDGLGDDELNGGGCSFFDASERQGAETVVTSDKGDENGNSSLALNDEYLEELEPAVLDAPSSGLATTSALINSQKPMLRYPSVLFSK
ncbi:unnamed protein product [Cuscuta campestris]|uniref:Uncharacterized protein n=1 Tax=Cuscuta campestris TaxID=132261 RepID=A0A484KPS0_9ASTE|nr:unnamed protein product [Cuscuta campestris]